MRLLLHLLVAAFIAASFPALCDDFASIALKKYAMLKVFEDCVGKENVAEMFTELKQAAGVCASKPALNFFKMVHPPAADSPVSNKEGHVKEEAKLSSLPVSSPFYFARPFVPPQFDAGVPYYPSNAYLRRVYGQYPQERFTHDYTNYVFGMMSNGGFDLRRKARYTADPKQATSNEAIQAGDSSIVSQDPVVEERAEQSLETSLFTNPTVFKLYGKLQYKIGNVTCIMQELRMLKPDMQPDYDSIKSRIQSCQMDAAIKSDFLEGVDTCKDFSQCVPLFKMKTPIPVLDTVHRSAAFMSCMKRRKIEACMKKDLREKIDTILGALDWATARSDDLGEELPPSNEADLFSMLFGVDVFSGDSFF